uniref:Kynurenine/2-aminoadipate aminotransferase n=1 Tax=Tetraselmis sp. GSL018 TaxID=582737 RepID=A0A061R2Z4_9CHLO
MGDEIISQDMNGGAPCTLSTVASARQPSQLRTLAPYLSIPEVVWLAGGLPPGDVFPFKKVTLTTTDGEEIVVDNPDLLYRLQQYTIEAPGYSPLRSWLKDHTRELHNPPNSKWDVVVTCGNFDATAKVFEALLSPGDVILVEDPSFPQSCSTLKPLAASGVKVVPVTLGSHGHIEAESLRAVAQEVKARYGVGPKLVYVITNGQNPTGTSMPKAVIQEIYDVCRAENMMILEDDPYFYLQLPGSEEAEGAGLDLGHVGSFLSVDTDCRVVRLDSFSKFLAPGLRIGWVTCADPVHSALVYSTQQTTQGASSCSAVLAMELLRQWGRTGLDRHLRRLQRQYGRKARAAAAAAERHLAGLASWAAPSCGMFMWLTAEGVGDTRDLMPELVEQKVVLVPGSFFYLDEGASSSFRLCFASASEEDLEEGVRRLGNVLRKVSATGGPQHT